MSKGEGGGCLLEGEGRRVEGGGDVGSCNWGWGLGGICTASPLLLSLEGPAPSRASRFFRIWNLKVNSGLNIGSLLILEASVHAKHGNNNNNKYNSITVCFSARP